MKIEICFLVDWIIALPHQINQNENLLERDIEVKNLNKQQNSSAEQDKTLIFSYSFFIFWIQKKLTTNKEGICSRKTERDNSNHMPNKTQQFKLTHTRPFTYPWVDSSSSQLTFHSTLQQMQDNQSRYTTQTKNFSKHIISQNKPSL